MNKLYRRKSNKKGFSLIELIVVIAILAIIAAIAIPRFAAIQARSEVKSDAATAAEIVNAARIYHADNGVEATLILMNPDYITPAAPQSGGAWTLALVGDLYQVTWTPSNGGGGDQTVTENSVYVYNPAP